MSTLEQYWRKYKWYIIGYVIYVCFISTIVADSYRWDKNEYSKLWVIWCIMLPLITNCICSYIGYIKNKGRNK